MKKIILMALMSMLISTTANATRARMIGMGENGDTGSYLLDDYRNLYRNPALSMMDNFAVVEFGSEEAGVFYDIEKGPLPYMGVVVGRNDNVDVFASNDIIGVRASVNRVDGSMDGGAGVGVTMEHFNAYTNWDFTEDDNVWNIGGSTNVKGYTLFGQYSDNGASDWFVGAGKVWDINPKMILKATLLYDEAAGLVGGIATDYAVTSHVAVFGSVVQSLKDTDMTELSLGSALMYGGFRVEGIMGTHALLDFRDMFTEASISMTF